MYSKIKVSGEIEVVTGLHIGSGGEFSAIGAVDSPVIRDPKTSLPLIPGSSIKGKLRSLLSRHFSSVVDFKNDSYEVTRLFGSSTSKDKLGRLVEARMQISDAFLCKISVNEFTEREIPFTETKFENTISRLSSVANPRQIERVVRGSKFDLNIIYNVFENEELIEDFKNIELALTLLENDYLGGGGTRGSGRVVFKSIKAEYVTGPLKGEIAYDFKND